MNSKFYHFILLMLLTIWSYGQTKVSGKVLDVNGDGLFGVNVVEKGTTNGTTTNMEGNFNLTLQSQSGVLQISYLGFKTQEVAVSSAKKAVVVKLLEDSSKLDEVVIVGTRGKPRTILDSPVPIDNINAADLVSSGQKTVDQIINYKVPSYNSSNQTISDATAHFDPSELRNLGPSRTLVLVNGKRKNQSALVYVNDTPGKGEVGTDMKSIPAAAIERVEVLRDGAAAQYGSDAIAGVINIVLKERDSGQINVGGGITTEGDGLTYNADINKGFKLNNGGFINLTGSYYYQEETNRAGEPGEDSLFGVDGTNEWIQDNPDLGMTIGQPEMNILSGLVNFGQPYNNGAGEFYALGGYTYRTGTSFALYRTPYWITDDFGLLTPSGETYNGFQPTFETTIGDLTATIGNKYNFGGWNTDVSFTMGSNNVDYLIGNTINVSLGANSPTEFDPGGYTFGNILGNLDVSKSFDAITLAFGLEARQETFEVRAGQEESYVDGGAQSFPGLQPDNALKKNRNNIGVYASVDFDITEQTLVGGAARFENYSDFGTNFSWKINARQLIGDKKGAIRTSLSTGFRAPSLHQIYLSNIQTLVSGGTVSNQGTFNNVSDVVRGLGIGELDAETSLNFSIGATYRFTDNISISADYYNIALDNRVLFTGEVGGTGDPTNSLDQTLAQYDVTSIKFFVNAMDTRTSGVDVVLNCDNIELGSKSDLDLLFSLNSNKTEIEGQINTPQVLDDAGIEIFNRKEQSRVTTARPNLKFTLGANFDISDLSLALNNTYFGEVTWQHATDANLDQTFGAKVITDLILGYQFSDKISANVTVNNLLNVYPDEIDTGGDVVTDLGGRFRYPWEVNQFGFNGTIVRAGLSFNF